QRAHPHPPSFPTRRSSDLQWATYHLVLRATHVPVSLAASFTALIAANLSGLLRPTPANVGVTQAALVVGLLPFGVAPEQAVAARSEEHTSELQSLAYLVCR